MTEPAAEVTALDPPHPSATPLGHQAPLQHDVAFSDDLEKLAAKSAYHPHLIPHNLKFLASSITVFVQILRKLNKPIPHSQACYQALNEVNPELRQD